jgi:membrane-associated phospholipid phosphatase
VARNDLAERAASSQQPAPRPLLSPAARPWAGAVLVICVAVTAVLGAVFAHQTRGSGLDTAIDARIQAGIGGDPALLRGVARLGSAPAVIAVAGALVLACLATRRWRGALFVLIAVPAAEVVGEYVLKPLIGRTMEGDLVFPSGHTTGVAVLAAAIAVLLTGPLRPPWPTGARLLLMLAALLATGVTAVAMIGMGAHYVTDTVGGAAVAVAMVLATALALDWFAARSDQRKPVSAPISSVESSSVRRVWR